MNYTDMGYKTLTLEASHILSIAPEDMAFAKLQYSKQQVNQAGVDLAKLPALPLWEEVLDNAVDVVDNFRAAHAFPLNTIQNRLRAYAKSIDKDSIIAQRLKRLSSILVKLDRFRTMRLWDM